MVHEIRWFVMVVLLIFGGISQASAAVTLRYAEAGPNRGTRAEAVQFFADEVERLSSGNLIIDIHWGGALLKWSGVMEGVSAGSADLGSVGNSY